MRMTSMEILRQRVKDTPGLRGATMITRSGKYFDFIDPQPDQICIEDIACGLSNTCRFNGQIGQFYSVAQHSLLVSFLVPEQDALVGLMHDAAEAYIGDMVKPLKQLCPDFQFIEERVEAAIFSKFGLPLPLPPSVKHADLCLLNTEKRDLTSAARDQWGALADYPPLDDIIWPADPETAREQFLLRWEKLGGAFE